MYEQSFDLLVSLNFIMAPLKVIDDRLILFNFFLRYEERFIHFASFTRGGFYLDTCLNLKCRYENRQYIR